MKRGRATRVVPKWAKIAIGCVIVAGLAGLAALNVGGFVANSSKVHVVAAENFWGNIVQQVGGKAVSVTSIISNPNVDPHLYESDAHDAIEVSSAALVIENGLGYDDFMDKLVSASPSSSRVVVTAANAMGITGSGSNPHIWYNVPQVPLVAARIEAVLASKDPKNTSVFERNLKTFDASLVPIEEATASIKVHFGGTPVAYTERVPGYLVLNAGLRNDTPFGFASAIEDGVDPSPADTYEMDSLIAGRRIRVLFYNSQTISPVTQQVKQLAGRHQVPVVGVSETMPPRDSYQTWQMNQVNELEQALDGK